MLNTSMRMILSMALVLAFGTGCTTQQAMSPEQVAAQARSAAGKLTESYGLPASHALTDKVYRAFLALLAEPGWNAVARQRPWNVTGEQWGLQLQAEGGLLLPDDVAQRYLIVKAKMVNDASDEECAAFARTQLRIGTAADVALWRQRLSRLSNDDLSILLDTELSALTARIRSHDHPAPSMSTEEKDWALRAMASSIRGDDRKIVETAMSAKDTSQIDGTTACKFARVWVTAASTGVGPGAVQARRLVLSASP